MSSWDTLVDARIRDWVQRGSPRSGDGGGPAPVASLETQLLADIVRLEVELEQTEAAGPRAALIAEIRSLRLQLNVLLEGSGRGLLARGLERR